MHIDTNKLSWHISPKDCMTIDIKYDGQRVMSLFMGEAMELAGRKRVMQHVAECDRTPWLRKWHDDAADMVAEKIKKRIDND